MNRSRFSWAIYFAALLFAWLPDPAASQLNVCAYNQTPCNIETRTDSTTPPTPDALNACTDGIDNDGNGYIDANDPHCQSEVLCQDGIDNDAQGGADSADPDCLCMGSFGAGSCTANDISISYTAQPVVSDGCINSDDQVTAMLTATITSGQPARYDLGMWLSLSGGAGNAVGPLCVRQAMIPVGTTSFIGNGTYQNIDGDRCGDGEHGAVQVYRFPFATTVPCTDLFIPIGGQGGWVDLGQCGSWNQPGGDTVCTNPGTIDPGTGSKCRCERGDTSIPGPNVRTSCTSFNTPTITGGNGGPTLDPGETAAYTFAYTNTVASCTPGTPALSDPFGQARCGTASFVRFVIDYTAGASTWGSFTYFNGVSTVAIPACGSPGAVPTNNGVVCNDSGLNRLIWAPQDANANQVLGVVSAFAGTRSLPFSFTLGGNAPANTTFSATARIYWDPSIDTTPTNGTISATEAVDLAGALVQNCGSTCSCSSNLSTTPVTLTSFEASEWGREVRFDWSTETEVGNVGFDIYATVEGERIRVNPETIPVAGVNSLEPKTYSATFRVPDGATSFEIVDRDIRGEDRSHGPFALGERYGAPLEATPIDWRPVRIEQGLRAADAGQARVAAGRTDSARFLGGATSSTGVDLLVDQTGLYRVTYEALAAAGFDLAGNASSQIGLFSRGAAVPIFVSATGAFGPGAFIEFYAEALDTIYTKTNVYALRLGQSNPARVKSASDLPKGAISSDYLETRRFERDLDYEVAAPVEDPFYDTAMFVFATPQSWNYSFTIDNLAVGSAGAALSVEIYGMTDLRAVNPDHRIEALVNGTPVGTDQFDGMVGRNLRFPVPTALLAEGANTLTLRLPGVPGAPYDLIYLDAFSISYPRSYRAAGGRLNFTAAGPRFDVSGLPTNDVVAYRRDAKGGWSRFSRLDVVASGDGTFTARVPGTSGAQLYAVGSAGALLSPRGFRASRSPQNLLAAKADYLMISHPAFINGLSSLVAARQSEGYTVRVVDVEDVYASYSAGVFDPQAIRSFIADAHRYLGTDFVLLVGGDAYDYHNYLGLGAVSFLPTLYVQTGAIVHHAPADSLFADVDGDGVQDLAIGRFPVRSAADLSNMVAKTLAYDAYQTGGSALLAADYSDVRANVGFDDAADRMMGGFTGDWLIDRAYLDQTTLESARAALFTAFGDGTSMIGYFGHSGYSSWGSPSRPVSQHLFTVADINSLAADSLPGFVTQFGCWNTYFPAVRSKSLGAELVLAADRGPAAVMGAATLTDDVNSNDLAALLSPRLAEPSQTLGGALVQAKWELNQSAVAGRDLRDVLYGFTLLGDPALRTRQ